MIDVEVSDSDVCPKCKTSNIKKEEARTTKGHKYTAVYCYQCRTETRRTLTLEDRQ